MGQDHWVMIFIKSWNSIEFLKTNNTIGNTVRINLKTICERGRQGSTGNKNMYNVSNQWPSPEVGNTRTELRARDFPKGNDKAELNYSVELTNNSF